MTKFSAVLIILLLVWSCTDKPKNNGVNKPTKPVSNFEVKFNEDSAYAYIEKQVAFGPRVPGSNPHGLAGDYLLNKLNTYCDTAFFQIGRMKNGSGGQTPIKNIVGVFNPKQSKRILLCAHWDTRPQADEDPERPTTPADGANDGASGVGVLLEVARQIQQQKPDVGIDILFFDAEDMGQRGGNYKSWCLGSQYWAANPHVSNYVARYGILLDMVGAKNAKFAKEGYSMEYAKPYVQTVWQAGKELGHYDYFIPYLGGTITDDHYFINTIIGIPTLDIIQHDNTTQSGFGHYWHTHKDNMSIIDKATLNAVGETVFKVVQEF